MGKLGGGGGEGGREFGGKNISFAGRLGTENEKAIDSIANVNPSFFQFENRWS